MAKTVFDVLKDKITEDKAATCKNFLVEVELTTTPNTEN
jgi:hypothetical protein